MQAARYSPWSSLPRAMARRARSSLTAFGTWAILAAGVPGRMEYGKTWSRAKPQRRRKARVSENSSSVSSGKPVMRSVVMAGCSKYWFKSATDCAKREVSYFRFMRFRVASQPLCRERWNWGQSPGRAAARRQKSSVTVRGSRDPRRSRSSGAAAERSSSRSTRLWPFLKSWPQEEISMPVSTTS